MENLQVNGLSFRVEVHHDEAMREPWKSHDFHGVVSEWTRRDKLPGERVLASDRESKRYYNVQESMEIALRDGWGCENPEGKTKRQIAAEAVEMDFQRLRAWCNDEWYWCYVTVQLLGKDGSTIPGFCASLGGIESDSEDYIQETARELAEEIVGQVGDMDAICIPIR